MKELWIQNKCDSDVIISDLGFKILSGQIKNVYKVNPHFTEEQIRKSLESGSLYRRIKNRRIYIVDKKTVFQYITSLLNRRKERPTTRVRKYKSLVVIESNDIDELDENILKPVQVKKSKELVLDSSQKIMPPSTDDIKFKIEDTYNIIENNDYFLRRPKMRTLVISDLHIGDLRYKHEHVIKLLNTEKFDRLIINGDFIDLWLCSISKIVNDELFKHIESISRDKEVILIKGNHDSNMSELEEIFRDNPNVFITEFLRINENNKKILIMHGHQIYFRDNDDIVSKCFSKLNHFIYKHFGIDFQTYFNSTAWYEWICKRNRKIIMKKYSKEADTIIIGHTHRIAYLKQNSTELFDIGNPYLTHSYGIIEDGVVKLEVK